MHNFYYGTVFLYIIGDHINVLETIFSILNEQKQFVKMLNT